ncbi:MAG: tRNA (adenosine(37)-N6)-dimethylallyltransferase MiaA [Legionella sp.]|nr:tRNA (adenosine(37)-N6)-dimethylallyltransferase MiaA [Legionella sp.]
MHDLIFCIMGPTGSGKTALACELAQSAPFEIISVDSALVYRGMDIGTAKPRPEQLLQTPHHLIDILDPIQSYSAAAFCQDALHLCDQIFKRGKIPLLVGGTMMYFKALQQGLSVLPQSDDLIRKQLEIQVRTQGLDALHHTLMQVDAKAAARIHSHDAQRIQRALEVYYITGRPLSDLTAQSKAKSPFRFINILLFPQQRTWLHERIALRFKHMLEAGFIDEVKKLQSTWDLNPQLPAMRCVGYKQVWDYLQGTLDYPTMTEKGIAATRQLAKRQLTWLRSWEDGLYFDPQKDTFIGEIVAKIKEILDNGPSNAAKELL